MMHRQVRQDLCGAPTTTTTTRTTTTTTTTTTLKPLCRTSRRGRRNQSTSSLITRRPIELSSSSSSLSSKSASKIIIRTKSISRPITNTNSILQNNHSSTTFNSSNSRSLLAVLAWSMTLLLVSSCLGIADAGALMGHPFSKRSFMDIQCKGVYDKSLFARLDRICEDCYNLFREPQLHTLCRKTCFTSDYFKGCLDALLLDDEVEWIQTSIKQLHGAEPGV